MAVYTEARIKIGHAYAEEKDSCAASHKKKRRRIKTDGPNGRERQTIAGCRDARVDTERGSEVERGGWRGEKRWVAASLGYEVRVRCGSESQSGKGKRCDNQFKDKPEAENGK